MISTPRTLKEEIDGLKTSLEAARDKPEWNSGEVDLSDWWSHQIGGVTTLLDLLDAGADEECIFPVYTKRLRDYLATLEDLEELA
jgi:hypothetical protein